MPGMTLTLLPVLALSAALSLAGITVCPKCGYEAPHEGATCEHCGATIAEDGNDGEVVGQAAEPDVANDRKDQSGWAAEFVKEEIAAARSALRQGKYDLAKLLLRNASAVESLVRTDGESDTSLALLTLIQKCDGAPRRIREKCGFCGGTGKRELSHEQSGGKRLSRSRSVFKCPRCGGDGITERAKTVDERKYDLGQALREFRDIQTARKRVLIGRAWVPVGIVNELTLRDKVALKKACAAPCGECMGLGLEQCQSCRGLGEEECSNDNCRWGWVKRDSDGSIGSSLNAGYARCPECGGRGSVPCRRCAGRGSSTCEKCGGTGERPLCRKCGGEGIIECGKCNGSGVYKGAVCPECGGAGIEECRGCHGDGRSK